MTVKVMYYNKKFKNKPKGWENAEIQKNLEQTEISLEELAIGLSNGATFKPALLNGTKSTDWVQQQLFALDFDHNSTINEELNRCKELNILPCFGYTSFSHTENEHRFRLVFCTDKVIIDKDKRDKMQITLINLFSNSDVKTKDATRLFYGGRSLINCDYNNRIDIDYIIDKYGYLVDRIKAKKSTKKNILHREDKKKQPTTYRIDENMALKIEAIKALNVEVLQSLLKEPQPLKVGVYKEDNISYSIYTDFQLPDNQKVFKSQKDLYDYINSVNLCEYLGIYDKVCCILPEHDDSTPSAHIYKTDSGTQVYKCFGCDKCYTIIGITEKLAKCKRSEAIEFIKKVYNLHLVQSDWVKKQKQLMIDSANYLDTDEFKTEFPELSKLIRTRKVHIQKMLMHFTQYVNDDLKVNNKPLFFGSSKTLMGVCGIKGGSDKLFQSLTLFSLLNMIDKVALDKIPEKELKKAKHIAAKYGHKKLTNFYSFEEYGVKSLENSEEIARTLKANNFTLKGLSREYILRTFGEQLANKCYPQYKYENKIGTSKKSDNHTLQIVECVFYLLDKNNYATEKDIIYLLGNRYRYQSTGTQIKKSLQEILLSYDLVRVKASKANKEKYGIDDDSLSYQSYIICRNNEE